MIPSTAPEAGWRTSSKTTRAFCTRTVPHVIASRLISFGSFSRSAAYVLLHALAEKGLKGSRWASAQFNTIQNRILKVGARAKEMVTRVRFCLPTSFPLKKLFKMILFNLAEAFI